MELTPGVVMTVAVVAVLGFAVIRWGRRHEAAPPVDAPSAPVRSSAMAAREQGEGHPLVNWLLDRAFEQTGVRVDEDPLARQRIEEAAAKAMEELRTRSATTINLPFLVADRKGPRHFSVQVKRNVDSTFEVQR